MTSFITVKCLSETTKDYIVSDYKAKVTLARIAKACNTSSRTVGRVLEERGLATPVPRLKGEAYAVMKLLKGQGITDAAGVQEMFNKYIAMARQPVVTAESVQMYLNQCTKEQLAKHFYTSGLIKIAEITKEEHARKQHQSALFKQPPQQDQAQQTLRFEAGEATPA